MVLRGKNRLTIKVYKKSQISRFLNKKSQKWKKISKNQYQIGRIGIIPVESLISQGTTLGQRV
jgi:hypothetical protein